MYALSFDLSLALLVSVHPKGYQQAYRDIERTLAGFGFRRIQQSVYVTDERDFGRLISAVDALRTLAWFSEAVTDIRAFRVEDWSNLTHLFKGPRP